MVAKGQLTAA
jgi:hypothetical protein